MTIYVVDLEEVETRYTKQWKKHLPLQLKKHCGKTVQVISGGDSVKSASPGAFLNFGYTNVYKAKQIQKIAELFSRNEIKSGDYFLYTDAWNPTVLQLKYMAELLNIKIKIGGMWHAGSYDPQDFLGRLIGDKPWVRQSEIAMFNAFDHNFFATEFHIELFLQSFPQAEKNKMYRVGWPMEYLDDDLTTYKNITKENIILFPHRLAPEKQHDIFMDLSKELPKYSFITCLDVCQNKNDYHNLLAKAKIIFSANLQETLGISWYEGCVLGVIPMIPNRLSYKEMALSNFKYPSEWTLTKEGYFKHKELIKSVIVDYIENYKKHAPMIWKQKLELEHKFFSGTLLYKVIQNV